MEKQSPFLTSNVSVQRTELFSYSPTFIMPQPSNTWYASIPILW